jgi:hypothetical protein
MPFNPQKKYKYHIFYAILSTNEKIEIPHIQSTELKKKNSTHSMPLNPQIKI